LLGEIARAALLLDQSWDVTCRLGSRAKPSDRLAKALTMLGRVVKTIHILRYAHDAQLRARIRRQLNRGESRHALARRLFFANQGTFRAGDRDEEVMR
jgi:TnpA family transposase